MWLTLLCSSDFAGAVAWALARAMRQSRQYESLGEDGVPGDPNLPAVAAIVPVRNEAGNVATCLRGLREQDYPRGRLRIIVVDDESGDDTAAIVRGIALADSRVRLIEAAALPAGWAGKPHACWLGALAAEAEWLCFMDADTIAEPGLMRSAVLAAGRRNLAMMSLAPFQELSGFFDRLLIPLGFLMIAATMDPARSNRPDSSEANANGQFILVRSEIYFRVGGHSVVRNRICEDAALARQVKAAGFRVALLGSESLIRVRMYRTARELWEGLSKNVAETFGGPVRTSAIAAGALVLAWMTPLLPAFATLEAIREPHPVELAAAAIALLAAAAVVATQLALVRHFRVPLWYGLLFPLACTAGALLAFYGVVRSLRGGIPWKGRVYSFGRDAAELEAGRSPRTNSNDP
jgi:chlorobactene glucosyltransferase